MFGGFIIEVEKLESFVLSLEIFAKLFAVFIFCAKKRKEKVKIKKINNKNSESLRLQILTNFPKFKQKKLQI